MTFPHSVIARSQGANEPKDTGSKPEDGEKIGKEVERSSTSKEQEEIPERPQVWGPTAVPILAIKETEIERVPGREIL